MTDYADSSFLASCYVKDANTPTAQTFLKQSRPAFVFTDFHSLEVSNAFEQLVFRKLLEPQESASAVSLLAADLQSGRLIREEVEWGQVFLLAAQLSERFTRVTGARSLDILHVESATLLKCDAFVSFDFRQRALAKNVGLTVVP